MSLIMQKRLEEYFLSIFFKFYFFIFHYIMLKLISQIFTTITVKITYYGSHQQNAYAAFLQLMWIDI